MHPLLPSLMAGHLAAVERGAAAADREEIRSVIAAWGLYRDTGQFEELRALFAPGATIQTTWFDGGADEFVDRSKASFGGSARAHHFFGASKIDLHADRATADTRIMLQLRTAVDDICVDATCYGRVFDFFVRHDNAWRILRRVPVYDKDRLDSVDPSRQIVIDAARLARFPEGYRHIAYLQALGGSAITAGLIQPGSAAERQLYEEGRDWLRRDSTSTSSAARAGSTTVDRRNRQ
jgi:hypothetical protein